MSTMGSIVPSSPFLIRKMLENIDFQKSKIIVEFGIGDGCITEEILKRMIPDSKLICFEIDAEFCASARKKFIDNRFVMIEGSVEGLTEELKKLSIAEIDTVISSLPLALFKDEMVKDIMTQVKTLLKKDGMYMQYQYSLANYKDMKKYFSKVKRKVEMLNIPPAVVYTCRP